MLNCVLSNQTHMGMQVPPFKKTLMDAMPYVDFLFGNETEARAFAESEGWTTTDVAGIALKVGTLFSSVCRWYWLFEAAAAPATLLPVSTVVYACCLHTCTGSCVACVALRLNAHHTKGAALPAVPTAGTSRPVMHTFHAVSWEGSLKSAEVFHWLAFCVLSSCMDTVLCRLPPSPSRMAAALAQSSSRRARTPRSLPRLARWALSSLHIDCRQVAMCEDCAVVIRPQTDALPEGLLKMPIRYSR